MKIHRLRLRHVKGVTDVTVEFPDSGLLVIQGPNEVGKSTLLEALDRLLDMRLKSTSRAASITGLQPVGLDVGPYVEAELSLGGVRLVFAKQWLRQPSTVLTVLEPAREVLTGDDAVSRMTQILDRGLDRTLLEALRCAQSGSLRGIELDDSDAFSRALDAAGGTELHTDEGADLVSAAQQEYERYYTATGRPTGALRVAVETLNAATDTVVETQRALAEADELVARRLEAATTLAAAEAELPAADEEWVAAGQAVQHLEAERARRARAEERLVVATAELRRAEQDQRARARLVEEVAERETTVQRAEADVLESESALRDQSQAEKSAQAECSKSEEELAEADAEYEAAAAALRSAREQAETAQMTQRLRAARTLTEGLEGARERLAAEPVSPSALRELEELERELAVASAGADAASTTLTLQAVAGPRTVRLNEQTVSLEEAGASTEHQVAQGVELMVDGLSVQIQPHPEAVRLGGQRERLREELQRQLSALGCASLVQARRRAVARERVQHDVDRLAEQLANALAGAELDELSRAVAARADLAGGEAPATDLETATRQTAHGEERLLEARRDAEHARRVLTDRSTSLLSSRSARELARARRRSALDELERVTGELDRARAVHDDEGLVGSVHAHAQAVQEARALLGEASASPVGDDTASSVELRLAAASERRARARAQLDAARAEFHDVKGRLEVTAAEGRHEAHERAQQVLEDARRRYESVARRARAARHLHTTLQRHRDQAHESYAAPYAREIERLGAAVYGDSFAVSVDSRLAITHRELDGVRVRFDQLSGGAAEQLGILARLAVAAMVDDQHCAPVVIDDALGFTDPERLERIGRVVGSSGQQHPGQIIVLTCTPHRYDGVAGAHRVTLSA